MSERYPRIWGIIIGYFHEDSDLFGDDARDFIADYKSDASQVEVNSLIDEIDRFKSDNNGDLSSAFAREFRSQFIPESWGYTPETFLEELKQLLKK